MDTATSNRVEHHDALLERAKQRILLGTSERSLDYEEQHRFNNRILFAKTTLDEFSDEVIKKVYEATADTSQFSTELISLLGNGYRSWVIHEHLTFQPLIPNHEYPIIITGALHYYGELPRLVRDYADCDPIITEQAAALVIAAAHLHEYSSTAPKGEDWIPLRSELHRVKISNHLLVQLIMEYPQKAKRIAEVVIEWKTVDTQFIRSIIESPSQPLSKGTL